MFYYLSKLVHVSWTLVQVELIYVYATLVYVWLVQVNMQH